MLDILDQVVQNSLSKRPEKFRRFLHKAQGYLGIFLEESSTNWLSESVSQFAEKIKTALGKVFTCIRAIVQWEPVKRKPLFSEQAVWFLMKRIQIWKQADRFLMI